MVLKLVFGSEVEATTAVQQINANIVAAVSAYNPAAIVDGAIVGRNAATNQFDYEAQLTTTWDVPLKNAENEWEIHKPINLQPAAAFEGIDLLAGVSGYEEIDI